MRYRIVFVIMGFVAKMDSQSTVDHPIFEVEKERVLKWASRYTDLKAITVTNSTCERSAGGKNDFYSEGDYWWPDSANPDGPYIRKDGVTNPNNFTAHREAMIRFSQISGAFASAYIVTENPHFAEQLLPHLRAWFLNAETMMSPHLLYAQAIKGKATGRGIGIIDTIHLMEVAKAIRAIEPSGVLLPLEMAQIKKWFSDYLRWITTHPYGIAERNNGNNHSICWALQVAVFAELVENKKQLQAMRTFYKEVLLPDQLAVDGSFPLEIKRTKPYGYSLFTLDAMVALSQVASTSEDSLFDFSTKDGKNIGKGITFLYPYTKSKNSWPFEKDVMHWDEWPVRHPYLLFGGLAFENEEYLALWSSLKADFDTPEVLRNMPIRYPLLWVE